MDAQFRPEDHDYGEKTFLGHTGNFDGEDVIDIICQQPATARFIARHLYNFFVADESQVPAWQTVPPGDPEAIKTIADAFVNSNYDMRSVLRVILNSDFFKKARFARVAQECLVSFVMVVILVFKLPVEAPHREAGQLWSYCPASEGS